MKLLEFFNSKKPTLFEGGNVGSDSPGWQGMPGQHQAQEIDLKLHNRDFMVEKLRELLKAQNQSFSAVYGRPIWNPKLLDSNKMFSGSSLHFFDVKGITTDDFLNKLKKTKVGDIDTQVDREIKEEITAWLKSIIGKKIGNGTFVGFNASLSALWQLDDPPVKIQVDYELGPYDPETQEPTEWFKFSHSAEYEDMAQGIKGVFHKYLYRSLPTVSATEKYVATVYKKKPTEISPTPVVDSDLSFAVKSAQGGGLSVKYKDYIDPNTGKPMFIDEIPVKVEVDSKDRDYIQNLDQQFEKLFGRKRTKEDIPLQNSFLGTIKLMNQTFKPEQNEQVARQFLKILFEPGEQMISKGDPIRDREIKFAAVDAMLLGNKEDNIQPLKVPNPSGLRDEAVEMAIAYEKDYNEVEEFRKANPDIKQPRAELKKLKMQQQAVKESKHIIETEGNPAVVASPRQGVTHLEKMKGLDFLNLLDELRDETGGRLRLNNIKMTVKIDGAGGRFGKDSNGRPFYESSSSGPIQTPGSFSAFAQKKGTTDPVQLDRAKKYDELYNRVIEMISQVDKKYGKDFLKDVKVHCEFLYKEMATPENGKLKFVNVAYNQLPKGVSLALVPLFVEVAGTGESHPNNDDIKQKLIDLGQLGQTMFIDNRLLHQGEMDVTGIVQPLDNIDELKAMLTSGKRDQVTQAEAAIQPIKDNLAKEIISNPNIVGKDKLGSDYEGIILYTKRGPIKVTTPYFKDIMAKKTAEKQLKKQNQPVKEADSTGVKKAIVTVGNFMGHKGHQELIQTIFDIAKKENRTPFVYIAQAYGSKDPVSPQDRKKTLDMLFPEWANQIQLVDEGSFAKKIEIELSRKFIQNKQTPYKDILVVVGDDRVEPNPNTGKENSFVTFLKRIEDRLNNPQYPASNGTKITVVGRSEFQIPKETIRSTDLRNKLKENIPYKEKLKYWIDNYDSKLPNKWVETLMNKAAETMGVNLNKSDRKNEISLNEHIEREMGLLINKILANEVIQISKDIENLKKENFAEMKEYELVESLSKEFLRAVEDWKEMQDSNIAAKVILSSPESEPFRRAPAGVTKIYRAIVPGDREINSIKSNGIVVACATRIEGSVRFAESLQLDDAWVVLEKPFNPADCLLDFTSMIEHYGLVNSRDENEYEVWMKPTPQYRSAKKSEVILTDEQYYDQAQSDQIYDPASNSIIKKVGENALGYIPRKQEAFNQCFDKAWSVSENFADGKNPGRKGLAKRMGVPTKASVSRLRQIAKNSTGEKARMAHWMANMKSGKKK